MHRPSALMSSTTMISPVAAPLMPDSPYYPAAVPTPPPSASPADLPPIPELSNYGRHLTLDDGPPSPASPKKQKDALPAYLEPTPQVYELNATSKIRPQLFHLLSPPLVSFPARRATAPALTHSHQHPSIYSPLPRRSHSQSVDYIRSTVTSTTSATLSTGSSITDIGRYPSTPSSSASSSPTTLHQQYHRPNNSTNQQQQQHFSNTKKRKIHNQATPISTTHSVSSSAPLFPFQGQDSCTSPTLAAACASAANLHTSPSSVAASTLSSPSSPSPATTQQAASGGDLEHSRRKPDDDKKQVDQSMFLTKNAHIKRPRNAWIHFRCHYGQALKTQDPTLRAEEISKRASRRWSLLSENEKRPWHQLAEQEKQAHKEAFPEYRYCPKRATTVTATIHPPAPPPPSQPVTTQSSSVTPSTPPSASSVPPVAASHQGLYRLPRLSNDMDTSRIQKKLKKM
ncbi:hypothetical protein BCR42DRAFT_420909 [Absidia repens]|uniref:HMG box domain-containing protein n=1 Tax=Absidia repens TaxID=90262 RepID=A0A1X2I905_9FUNG|nr:hypothetical protein BCR42DRAFT_420909 [Absidia repens]